MTPFLTVKTLVFHAQSPLQPIFAFIDGGAKKLKMLIFRILLTGVTIKRPNLARSMKMLIICFPS